MKSRVLFRTILYHSHGITILIYIFYTGAKPSVLMNLDESMAPIQSLTPQPSAEEIFLVSNFDLITSVSGLAFHFPTSRRQHSIYGLVIINIWLSICCHPNPNKGGMVRQTISRITPQISPYVLYF